MSKTTDNTVELLRTAELVKAGGLTPIEFSSDCLHAKASIGSAILEDPEVKDLKWVVGDVLITITKVSQEIKDHTKVH